MDVRNGAVVAIGPRVAVGSPFAGPPCRSDRRASLSLYLARIFVSLTGVRFRPSRQVNASFRGGAG